MSAKELVAKLRAMAADPSHRTNLLKEAQTLPTLLVSLSDTDTDISFTALEVRIISSDMRASFVGWKHHQGHAATNLKSRDVTALSSSFGPPTSPSMGPFTHHTFDDLAPKRSLEHILPLYASGIRRLQGLQTVHFCRLGIVLFYLFFY